MPVYENNGEYSFYWDQPVTVQGWQGEETEVDAQIELTEQEIKEMLGEIQKEKKRRSEL